MMAEKFRRGIPALSLMLLICSAGCNGGGGDSGSAAIPTEDGSPAITYSTGVLDAAFGTTGKISSAIGFADDIARAVALQSDGKIVAAGFSSNGSSSDFALVRYNTNGSLDTAFGSEGKVLTDMGSANDEAYAVAIQPDGKIVAAGKTYSGTGYDFALARYNTNGSLDTAFGSNGTVVTALGSANDEAYAVAIQSDGKIVAAGLSSNGSTADFALARYNTNGSLDTAFGSNGTVTTAIGAAADEAYAVAVQSDGKIVAAGLSSNGVFSDFALARYNTNGSLDTTFGSNGRITTAIGAADDEAYAVALQGDGKIVAAGLSTNGAFSDFALARYNTNGSLDTTFGSNGRVTTAMGSADDEAYAVALQGDGKIVAAGQSYTGSGADFALVRYR